MRISAVRSAVDGVSQRLVELEHGSRLVEVELGGGLNLGRSDPGDWSRRKSPCGGPRAGERGGGRWGRWRRTKIERTTGGSVRKARILI
jgi:hypothetical protein